MPVVPREWGGLFGAQVRDMIDPTACAEAIRRHSPSFFDADKKMLISMFLLAAGFIATSTVAVAKFTAK